MVVVDSSVWIDFFATLECELLGRHRFRSGTEARMAIFAQAVNRPPNRRHFSLSTHGTGW